MAIGDISIELADLNAAHARQEKLHPTKAQFVRNGTTARWFNPKGEVIQGKELYFRAFTTPSTGTRRSTITNGATTEWPRPSDFKYQEMRIDWTDLKMFRNTIRYNELEALKHSNAKYAVAELVEKAVGDAELDLSDQMNAAVYQPGTACMGKVSAIYDADGTTFSLASAHTPAFIKVKQGSISQFQPGMVLDIYDTDGTTKNAICVVHDVIAGPDGPSAAGPGVAGIGPGILVEPSDLNGAVYACNWNGGTMSGGGTSYTPAAGDYLARSGEFTTTASSYVNFHGFPDWFDTTVDCYKDYVGSAIDREAATYHWMNPLIIIPSGASEGSEVAFDMQTHFGEVEDNLPYIVKVRQERERLGLNLGDSEETIALTGAMLAVTTPEIVNDAVAESQGTHLFNVTAASTLDAARRKALFGHVGFEGIVYHSGTLPPIALQGDTACTKNEMYIIEPNSFHWVTIGGSPNKIRWLSQGTGGGKWMRLEGETLRTPTAYLQAAYWTAAYLNCDQPKANAMLKYVKSSRD